MLKNSNSFDSLQNQHNLLKFELKIVEIYVKINKLGYPIGFFSNSPGLYFKINKFYLSFHEQKNVFFSYQQISHFLVFFKQKQRCQEMLAFCISNFAQGNCDKNSSCLMCLSHSIFQCQKLLPYLEILVILQNALKFDLRWYFPRGPIQLHQKLTSQQKFQHECFLIAAYQITLQNILYGQAQDNFIVVSNFQETYTQCQYRFQYAYMHAQEILVQIFTYSTCRRLGPDFHLYKITIYYTKQLQNFHLQILKKSRLIEYLPVKIYILYIILLLLLYYCTNFNTILLKTKNPHFFAVCALNLQSKICSHFTPQISHEITMTKSQNQVNFFTIIEPNLIVTAIIALIVN
eukprot:TRINITY_DN7915_c0_g2_i1.p1 TRINITY_DN7915_c0_g2~~TRINITY_DN7915_c0_g2_i1.p1  ORF type:complete len:347 (+),score=-35.17 TRINITY_DN7915_c0_g2_i1:77-1117(+)